MSGLNKRKPDLLLGYIFLLLLPAFLINLGLMPFILDEATRANVALEMIHSGNYITPTINGVFYYNKPPLFNWILVLFVKLTGSESEFVFRLPVVISLLLFSFTVYLTQRRIFGKKVAFFTALALLSCGRILFYDSYKGLIDITFSWVIYLQFWAVFYYFRKRQWWNLFFLAYIFSLLAFLMKGLPALVFLGITLLVHFISRRKFLKLFSIQHVSAFLLLLLIVALYFLAYSKYNSLENYFDALWAESAKRTFIDNPFLESIKHIVTFPFEFIYHFLPWTLLVVLLFKKGVLKFIWQNELSKYFSLVFLANILVYWVSPAIYARYLFMFLPLFFGVIIYVWSEFYAQQQDLRIYILKYLFLAGGALIVVGIIIFPAFISLENYDRFWLKYSFVLFLVALLLILYIQNRREWLLGFFALLLVSRVVFNFFILPDRVRTGTDDYQKSGAIVAASLSKGHELYLLDNTRIQHVSTYYIMRERNDILMRWYGKPQPGSYYILERDSLQYYPGLDSIFTFETRIEGLKLTLVEKKSD